MNEIQRLAAIERRRLAVQVGARRLVGDPDDVEAWHALAEAFRSGSGAVPDSGPYVVRDGCICRVRQNRDGVPAVEVLAYFDARIVEEVVEDDGVEQRRSLVLQGTRPDGRPLPRVTVSASDFARMDWVLREWGARAVVAAGVARRDELREAIQRLSGEVPERRVYTHTGWREVDGRWAFLHAGGAIGADGVEVRLPSHLAHYVLPPPPTDPDTVRKALHTVLRLREVWKGNPSAAWALGEGG